MQVARHPNRPCMLDYVERLFTEFTEVHGDRRFADDKAIVTGFGFFHGEPVAIVGHQKGRDTKQKIYRNFGYAKPEGYRKALRVMQAGARNSSGRSSSFIDTPAAYPGIESEERGVAEAIALNLREMALLDVPIVVVVCGEGGSGGALGIAVGDRVLMQEFGVYSVIPPEGCAAILWRDAKRKVEAAEALKITAPDLLALGTHRRDRQGADRRRAPGLRRGGGAASTRPSRGIWPRSQAMSAGRAARRALPEVPRDGPRSVRRSSRTPRPAGRHARIRNRPADAAAASGRTCPADDARVHAMAAALGVPAVIARLLCQRGLDDPDAAPAFLTPDLTSCTIRFCSPDMRAAVDRLLGGHRAPRAHRHPRRLRRRRHHVHGHPPPRHRAARRRRSSTSCPIG